MSASEREREKHNTHIYRFDAQIVGSVNFNLDIILCIYYNHNHHLQ